MNEKDWQILKTIDEEKNITRSAERLYISQPALTYRINQIENELNIKIFSRSNKGIFITEEGIHVVKYAEKMLLHFQKLKDNLMNLKDMTSGELRIGVSSNFAQYELPNILKNFLTDFPNVQVKLMTDWSNKIMNLFLNEEIHVAIVRGECTWKGPKIFINQDPISLISKQQIPIDSLPNHPMISYKTEPALKNIIDTWWREHFQTPPLISMEVDKLETCKEMVLKGLGFGVVPNYVVKHHKNNLSIQPLTSIKNKPIVRDLWLYYRKESLELSTVKAFIDFMEEAKLK
ncbi:LysR family transcriptional regulator [Oceanobacillus saliphilus]|uniref:LysR family transcriptional regulator n=1 Tax=Oceanobacillus saliphilus TaxID=2925834 RepID=UPI00201D911D|nr:LysR family transcriptional regulator [Oceanobacillus saliphilus]